MRRCERQVYEGPFLSRRQRRYLDLSDIRVEPLNHALTNAVEWNLLRPSAREELTAVKKLPEPDGLTCRVP